MNSRRSLLLLICLLGFSSLAFAGIDISFEQVNADGQIVAEVPTEASRLLAGDEYACTMILYTKENIEANGGLLAVLNIFGPPFDGEVNDLHIPGAQPSYWHNLRRIVYQGAHCDCTVTIHQSTDLQGKSINYYSQTAVRSSDQTKIDIDPCWAGKAESLSIQCSA